ncbi:MAG TPA: HRDC domain-containing protein [Anaerolineae bacterium]|nr:HRDC domain-containing protein [Anaerolineae bacterium]
MSTLPPITPYQLITTTHDWHACLTHLEQVPRLAIDLESNSMFAYQEEVCLIQISTTDHDFIVDPLANISIEHLGPIINNPDQEKILHAAEYDLMLMQSQYGWQLNNLFDTMWAARILGHTHIGLANVLKNEYGLTISKKYQRSNWSARPLSDAQLAYAQRDTHYLIPLRHRLNQELEEKGFKEEAEEIFEQQTHVKNTLKQFHPDDFWNAHGVRRLSASSQAILKELFLFRDREAQHRDRPPFKIFGDKTLLAIAQQQPDQLHELENIKGMSKSQLRRYGRRLLAIVHQHRHSPAPKRPRYTPRPPEDVYHRYELLHTWRKERAKERGVESDVILNRDTLWAIAHACPTTLTDLEAINGLGPYRRRTYGQEILDLLH